MHIRVNPAVKKEVEPILQDIGVSLSEVFNMLLNQIRIRGEIPFTLVSSYYSPELIKTIQDSEKEIATAKKYDDVELMHKEIFDDV
jgi:addiction module RelB/DinJ family antitoxin